METQEKWLKAPQGLDPPIPFIKGKPSKILDNNKVQYTAKFKGQSLSIVCNHQQAYQVSDGKQFDDMCEMQILNEPEVLNNLVVRYNKDEIFTFIGPTLIVMNPYKIINKFFNNQIMLKMRQSIIQNRDVKEQPHIYLIAGKAYNSMINAKCKQAIVISGQSGAGKTQSTKYCMRFLTSLSHKQAHPIQGKILACNPLLQAFGNSKTVRNDNSSRFGKFIRIFFGADNHILGATINSYLLEKSRVVSTSLNERSFHIFYALTTSGIEGLKGPENYKYLSQSKCYSATGFNDRQYFQQISSSMDEIGFKRQQKQKIWKLVAAILYLGNVQFDDVDHKNDQNKPCKIVNPQQAQEAASKIKIKYQQLCNILLFEKKKFLKQFTNSPRSKQSCIANRNTFSKALYNAIFEFILFKIQISIKPQKSSQESSISILDIFGFQNFEENTFEQLCINFTNQKLLKLYNRYIFERQMEILKEDGLGQQIKDIVPPTNDDIIAIMSGNLSLFSIINDLTTPQQFKDQDMVAGFNSRIPKSKHLTFHKMNNKIFEIKHSQCDVSYSIQGFKNKNQDKMITEIQSIVNNLFQNQNKDTSGKTLLYKFVKDIQSLMSQLQSSSSHFVRCIKPNQLKKPNFIDEKYVLTQVRYLGVFETIQIRKKTYPCRKSFKQFSTAYKILDQQSKKKNDKQACITILKKICKNQKDFMIGSLRVYITQEIQAQLNERIFKMMKVKNQKAKIIQRAYRKYKRIKRIKLLVKMHRIYKKINKRKIAQNKKKGFEAIKKYVVMIKQIEKKQLELKKKQEEQSKNLKFLQEQKKKQEELLKKKQQELQAQNLKKSQQTLKKDTKKEQPVLTNQSTNLLDESIVIQDVKPRTFQKVPAQKQKKSSKIQPAQFKMNESFMNDQSIYIPGQVDSVFKRTLNVDFFQPKSAISLQKLKDILSENYKLDIGENQEDYFSPNSKDCEFNLQNIDPEMKNKILTFSYHDFFKNILRKRSSFFGIQKTEEQILTAKPRPLAKSLTSLSQTDQQQALKIFKILVKIGQQTKLENVFKLIQSSVEMCKGASQQLKNQIFLMLLKQSNTPIQLSSVRILQCMAVFLHIYAPDSEFLYASLSIFFEKLKDKKFTEKQEQYVRYLFKKILRILQKPFSINYMPIKYQMMALMCKRQISVPVYLPIGNSILIRVQSYHTFADIKQQVMAQFGIDHKRLFPQLFTFFEIVNFENEQLGQSPINENQIVWDVMTYWQKAKQKYKETQIIPPAFFLMLKIRYAFECFSEDEESIELLFAQCYFDYFIGRIKMETQKMAALAACIKLIKLSHKPIDDIMGSYPIWVIKNYNKDALTQMMKDNVNFMISKKMTQTQIKYRFLTVCQECPLALAFAIPTQQPIKLFFKPKMIYLTQKCSILEQYPIRSVVKYLIESQRFLFDVRSSQGKLRTQAVSTEHAQICSKYLSTVVQLITRNSQKNRNMLKNV